MQIQKQHLEEILKLSEPCSSYEGILQARWNRIPLHTPLRLNSGGTLEIYSRGNWNFESGPDFRNAKIMIDGKSHCGDVEIHQSDRDWIRHGHAADPEFKNVILHVVEKLESSTASEIPLYLLPPEEKFAGIPSPLISCKGKCAAQYAEIKPESIHEMFVSAGQERMHQRAEIILHDMIRYGSTRAFLIRLFDAYGFKRNRAAFGELLHRILKKYPENVLECSFEPLIWGESGLLPANTSGEVPKDLFEEAKKIWGEWWYFRQDVSEPIEWKRDGGRPLNSPERRIAGLCLFLRKFGLNPLEQWLNDLRNADSARPFCKKLLQSLILHDDFWNSHTTFRAGILKYPAAVTGEEKARELAVDILMPSLRALAMLKRDEKMMDRVDAAFRNLPKTQKNRVLTTAMEKWFEKPDEISRLFSDAASRQGVLHIYANYCGKISCDCGVCLIQQSLFS